MYGGFRGYAGLSKRSKSFQLATNSDLPVVVSPLKTLVKYVTGILLTDPAVDRYFR